MYLLNELKYIARGLTNVVHIGAHLGEEASFYHSMRYKVVWIEANPSLMARLNNNLKLYPEQKAINTLLAEEAGKTVTFHIANNGQSSSFLDLKVHLEKHPDVHYVGEVQLTADTLDNLHLEPQILNIDVQGAEINVIRGGLETIKKVQAIYAEVNFLEMYAGCCLIQDFDREMDALGFTRLATFDTELGWGDAIYARKERAAKIKFPVMYKRANAPKRKA